MYRYKFHKRNIKCIIKAINSLKEIDDDLNEETFNFMKQKTNCKLTYNFYKIFMATSRVFIFLQKLVS